MTLTGESWWRWLLKAAGLANLPTESCEMYILRCRCQINLLPVATVIMCYINLWRTQLRHNHYPCFHSHPPTPTPPLPQNLKKILPAPAVPWLSLLSSVYLHIPGHPSGQGRCTAVPRTSDLENNKGFIFSIQILLAAACRVLILIFTSGKEDKVTTSKWSRCSGGKPWKHWLRSLSRKHWLCSLPWKHWLCSLPWKHWLCSLSRKHRLCSLPRKHWLCSLPWKHWLCSLPWKHWLCSLSTPFLWTLPETFMMSVGTWKEPLGLLV